MVDAGETGNDPIQNIIRMSDELISIVSVDYIKSVGLEKFIEESYVYNVIERELAIQLKSLEDLLKNIENKKSNINSHRNECKVTERGDKILLAKVNKLAQHNSFLKEEIEQMKQKNNSLMKDLNIYSHKLKTHLVLEQKLSQDDRATLIN
ncbi:uncharacterized protein LOC109598770 isoform X2 [Aethina tumida]|uniref:uncharacterized protein LOC109598770 isoform X2 n=1 Tax=Aethina tumida TaxID=116153 RepID=UPI00214890D4|nr:uncharacterized protein LOC109598770 isoform X2 [Aethina tumida]